MSIETLAVAPLGLDSPLPDTVWVAVIPEGILDIAMGSGRSYVLATLSEDDLEGAIVGSAKAMGSSWPPSFVAEEFPTESILEEIRLMSSNVPNPLYGIVVLDDQGREIGRRYAR